MNKKSQITIFVILSIIILVVGAFIILSYSENQRTTLESGTATLSSDPQINLVREYVENCLKLEIKEQTYFNQFSGGYYETPPLFAFDGYLTVPFYVYDNQKQVPSIQELEQQLEMAVDNNIEFCINNLEEFDMIFEEINIGQFESKMLIQDGSILATLNVPINLLNNEIGESSNIERFQVEVESNFLYYYNLVNEFINLHNGDFSRIPISNLNILGYNNNFRYELKPQNFDVAIFNFIFEESGKEFPREFQFAIKYNWRFD
ncbi:MAG: hypothetical protein ACMXYB_03925 [Candidatus Woesearchaeota archaeon]